MTGFFGSKEEHPNKFAIAMGRLIQSARNEVGISQEELARIAYVHRNTINNIENGKRVPDALILSQIAVALEKPIAYFFPVPYIHELKEEDLSVDERTLLIHFRRIWKPESRLLAISQIKAIADLETKLEIQGQAEQVKVVLDKRRKK
jgi:transcriptional regulator with XRE-family HTH domain